MDNSAPAIATSPSSIEGPSSAIGSVPLPTSAKPLSEPAVIWITSIGHTVCHIGEAMFGGVLLTVKQEFDLEPFHATALASLGYVLLGVGALPVGVWADALGPARMLLVYFAGMAVAGLAVAAAPNLLGLFLALTALGLAASIYHPTGLALLSVGTKNRGRAMGINGVAGSLGVALGPVLGLLAASYGVWRWAYVGLALLSAGCAVVLLLLNRAYAWGRPTRAVSAHGSPANNGQVRPKRRHWLPLACFFAAMMLGGFNYRCLLTVLPTYLSGEQASARSSLMVFLTLGMGGVGQYLGGWLADHMGARRVYPGFVGLLIPLALALAFLEGTNQAVLVASLLAFCLFAQQPIENSLLAECTTAGRRSLSYGAKFSLTFGVGALAAPIAGKVWEATGSPAPAFFLLAGSALLMALLFGAFLHYRFLALSASEAS